MKIAISNIAWDKSEDQLILPLLKSYGLKGVEVAPTKVWKNPTKESSATIKAYRKFWEKKGVVVSSTQSILYGHPELTIFESKKRRSDTLMYIKSMVRVSAFLGAEVMVFGSPKNRNIENVDANDALEIASDFFFKVGEFAKARNVYFCIEPNPREYGTNFINNTKQAVSLVKQVNHPYFQLHLDSGALTMNREDSESAIGYGSPFLKHFHVSEKNLYRIGSTNVNHQEIARSLKNLKYDRWVAIEMRSIESPDNLKIIEESIKLTSAIYS